MTSDDPGGDQRRPCSDEWVEHGATSRGHQAHEAGDGPNRLRTGMPPALGRLTAGGEPAPRRRQRRTVESRSWPAGHKNCLGTACLPVPGELLQGHQPRSSKERRQVRDVVVTEEADHRPSAHPSAPAEDAVQPSDVVVGGQVVLVLAVRTSPVPRRVRNDGVNTEIGDRRQERRAVAVDDVLPQRLNGSHGRSTTVRNSSTTPSACASKVNSRRQAQAFSCKRCSVWRSARQAANSCSSS